MSARYLTLLVSAIVVTGTMAAFVVWVRRKESGRGIKTRTRALVAFLVATIVLGTSMTMFGRSFGVESALFAGTVTMVTLGWTAFANDVVAMRLPRGLRAIRPWELRRFPYRTLGVAAFGKFLRTSPLRHLNPNVYLRARATQPDGVRVQLEVAEVVHFWAMVFTVPYLILAAFEGWWSAVAAILLVHLFANIYPICHLRFARGRVARFLAKSG